MDKDLDILVRHLNEEVARGGFMRLEPTPSAPEIEIAAVWKQTLGMQVSAIAVVALGRFSNHPGDFAHCVKRRVARAIGYFPFFGKVTLYPVIFGRDILARSDGLELFMEGTHGRVALPGIHVVDLNAATELVRYTEHEGTHEDTIVPAQQPTGGLFGAIPKIVVAALSSRPVRVRFQYRRRTGRAMRSANHVGGRGHEFIPLIDRGVTAFVDGHEQQ
jgi:hypothetical protein